MVYDIELVSGAFGADAGFFIVINKEDGTPDDLTLYNSVTLIISDQQYSSPPERIHVANVAEFTADEFGVAVYRPTEAFPVPDTGRYYVQIFRVLNNISSIPTQKYSLQTTRSLPTQ